MLKDLSQNLGQTNDKNNNVENFLKQIYENIFEAIKMHVENLPENVNQTQDKKIEQKIENETRLDRIEKNLENVTDGVFSLAEKLDIFGKVLESKNATTILNPVATTPNPVTISPKSVTAETTKTTYAKVTGNGWTIVKSKNNKRATLEKAITELKITGISTVKVTKNKEGFRFTGNQEEISAVTAELAKNNEIEVEDKKKIAPWIEIFDDAKDRCFEEFWRALREQNEGLSGMEEARLIRTKLFRDCSCHVIQI